MLVAIRREGPRETVRLEGRSGHVEPVAGLTIA